MARSRKALSGRKGTRGAMLELGEVRGKPGAPGSLAARMQRRDDSSRKVPHLDTWKRLYGLAEQVKELAPWEFMLETDIFGIEMPQTDERVFVSVMGNNGEHLAVGIYVGEEALYSFLDIAYGFEEDPYKLMEVPQVQISFEDKETLEREDRTVIKRMNRSGRYRGPLAYPFFRSYRPGYFPWLIDAAEAEVAVCGLEQVLDVAPRFESGSVALGLSNEDELLMRIRSLSDTAESWEDRPVRVLPMEPREMGVTVDAGLVERVRNLPASEGHLEVDLFPPGARIQARRSDRPEMPWALLVGEPDSGVLLCTEMLALSPDIPGMLASAPEKVLEGIEKSGARPKSLLVAEERLALILDELAEGLGIEVEFGDSDMMESVREEMCSFMMRE